VTKCERCGQDGLKILTLTTLYTRVGGEVVTREVDRYCPTCLDIEVRYEQQHRGAIIVQQTQDGVTIRVDHEDYYF